MKKLMALVVLSFLPTVVLFVALVVAKASPAPKVFVCKYVGTPGTDERLQTGNNPISVSSNAIKDFQGVGSYFNDAQGRSYVLALDEGQEEPDVSQCPQPEQPPEEEPPKEPPVDEPDDQGAVPIGNPNVKPNPIVPLSKQEGK